ncbi:hypothetical protein CDAR_375401 [Caerostris darwini]|uniref:Uncharacterized protein n=1 Tax=Caerostris darwini TaxID=1538125 RepID=A0AAV4NWS3_9ARAC|nr:hypothetical protein CDAR_375401 [Caerostris darwini]
MTKRKRGADLTNGESKKENRNNTEEMKRMSNKKHVQFHIRRDEQTVKNLTDDQHRLICVKGRPSPPCFIAMRSIFLLNWVEKWVDSVPIINLRRVTLRHW